VTSPFQVFGYALKDILERVTNRSTNLAKPTFEIRSLLVSSGQRATTAFLAAHPPRNSQDIRGNDPIFLRIACLMVLWGIHTWGSHKIPFKVVRCVVRTDCVNPHSLISRGAFFLLPVLQLAPLQGDSLPPRFCCRPVVVQ